METLGEERLRNQLPLLFNWLNQKTDLLVCIKLCVLLENMQFLYDRTITPLKVKIFRMFHDSLQMAGFLQLAGGTNAHTINGLKKEGLFQTASIGSNIYTFGISICPAVSLFFSTILSIFSFFSLLFS